MFYLVYAFIRLTAYVMISAVKLAIWAAITLGALIMALCAAISSASQNRRTRRVR